MKILKVLMDPSEPTHFSGQMQLLLIHYFCNSALSLTPQENATGRGQVQVELLKSKMLLAIKRSIFLKTEFLIT